MAYSLAMHLLEKRVRRLAVLASVAVLVSALGGCGAGGGPAVDGPLSSGNSADGPAPSGSICVPGGRPQTFGDQQFTNYGHITVIVDRVVLLHPHNEHLVGSYAVPTDLLVGTVPWPPKYPGTPSIPGIPAVWKHRQPVDGFRLAPGKTFNMVLGVAAIAAGRRATSQGMLVYYHDSSGSYVARNYFANIISANTHTCVT
jgi:hypothetical protein